MGDTDDELKMLMKNLRLIVWVSTIVGALGGFLYWKEIGCITGTCPLKSQWQTMVPIGAYFGFVFGDVLKGFVTPKKNNDGEADSDK